MRDDLDSRLTDLFLILSDMTRLRLLREIARGEVSVGGLTETLGESQPKISRHLALMRENGVVETRRDGKHIYYSIAEYSSPAISHILHLAVSANYNTVQSEYARPSIEKPNGDASRTGHIRYDVYDDEMPVYLL